MTLHPAGRMCQRCGTRWAQGPQRLCRSCEGDTGADRRTIFERERDRLAAQRPPRRVPPYVPPPIRTVTIDHREYWVMWDGTMDGAQARGLSL